jgi:hypothetical protein
MKGRLPHFRLNRRLSATSNEGDENGTTEMSEKPVPS